MQYKNKKNLYKILFIAILLGFIISLVGCSWLSLGLLNVFDPQAQIRVDYRLDNLTAEGIANIWFTIFSLNEAEFIGEQFLFEYYNEGIKIPELSRTIGATFYVPPSPLSSFETPVSIPKETEPGFPVYFQDVIDYMKLHPLITEITSTITVMGTDGAGHSISKTIAFDLPTILPGIDFTPPIAVITVTPDTIGTAPFTVVFDASKSTDVGSGIVSYEWDFGDETTGTGITVNHTYDNSGLYFVTLTVTDLYGNEDYDIETITVNEHEAPTAKITTVPDPPTGIAPFEVYFDAYKSTSESGIVSYDWDFGDGESGTGITTNHTYDIAGTYNVYLTITDSNGYEAYDTKVITVLVAGKVNAVIKTTPDPASGTVPFTVGFDASESTTSASGATIISYSWYFNDGTLNEIGNTIPITTHTYEHEGTYLVQLTVEDSDGNVDYEFVSIVVTEPL